MFSNKINVGKAVWIFITFLIISVKVRNVDSCNLPEPEDGLFLVQTDTNLTLAEPGHNQTWCDEIAACDVTLTDDNSTLITVHVHRNVTLRIYFTGFSYIRIYEVEDNYSCNIENSSGTEVEIDRVDVKTGVINVERDVAQIDIGTSNLSIGTNVFMWHSDPNTTDCDTQFLLNVTVHDCPADDNGIVCSGRGICAISNQTARPVCQCCDRYGGVSCQQEFPMVTCSDVTCFNGGTCIEANATQELPGSPSGSIYNETATNATTCLCPIHVTGSRCEHVLTRCRANPCVHGICVDRAEGYQCYCVPGYHGAHCELEYNECLSSPCQNHGRCVDRLDAFECRCSHGHTGDRCEHKTDMCTPNPCHMNATCTYLGDRIHCACPTGYTGATCSDVIGACHSSPCHNHATCVEHGEEYHCACPITFAGKHCEYMMDVFAPPMEESEIRGPGHRHNLYIVAGTLATMVAVVGAVLVACYCRIYETYKQLRWHRLKSTVSRSYSCPDFDGPAARKRHDKRRLSLDTGLLESASICYENAAYDSQAPNSLSVLQV